MIRIRQSGMRVHQPPTTSFYKIVIYKLLGIINKIISILYFNFVGYITCFLQLTGLFDCLTAQTGTLSF